MSLQSVKGLNAIPGLIGRLDRNISDDTVQLDASGEYCGVILQFPRTGTLTKIGVGFGAVTVADTMLIACEGVNTATGGPDGTITPTNASGTVSPSANTTYWVALNGGAGVLVTAGVETAITVRFNSYVAGNLQVKTGVKNIPLQQMYPYIFDYLNGTLTLRSRVPNFGLEYSDGTIEWVMGCLPAVSTGQNSFHSGSNPDRRGLKFQVPYKCSVSGVLVSINAEVGFKVLLYDSDATTILAGNTVIFDKDVRGTVATGSFFCSFNSSVILNINTNYRVVVLPMESTASLTTYNLGCTDDGANKAMNAIDGGVNFFYTSCNGAPTIEGDWTDDTTIRPMIALLVDQLDDGVVGGSGMLVHPGMSGGLNG